ncbi:Tn3 family transposase [Rhizobium beringeri]
MTRKQRDALLTLPETEVEVLRHHMLGPADLAAVNQCRTPETRLSYALQLCCLRFPGRYLSRGELLPGIMLDHIADQVQADADVITLFARRGATRYEQLTSIKQRHGFRGFERRWSRYVFTDNSIDRSYYRTGHLLHPCQCACERRRVGCDIANSPPARKLLAPASPATPTQPVALVHAFNAEDYLADRMAALDAALLNTERHLSGKDAAIFADGKLRFPKEPRGDNEQEQMRAVTARLYAMMPRVRITDLLDQVNHWTDFTEHFSHVSTGLPPVDQRAFMAALIAEATNLGLSRMAEMCGTVTRRALLRMQTWHMREDTYRTALASMTDAIHAEPLSVWIGEGWRASADGQAYYLGGPGEAGGAINGHYGRDPIVKIYTTITDRYAPLHQKVIAGTAGEAIHALDGILGHESNVDIGALHVDGGGVSDIVFAIAALLGRSFEPRIPAPVGPQTLCIRTENKIWPSGAAVWTPARRSPNPGACR